MVKVVFQTHLGSVGQRSWERLSGFMAGAQLFLKLQAQELMPGPGFIHCLDLKYTSVAEEDIATQRQQVRSIN